MQPGFSEVRRALEMDTPAAGFGAGGAQQRTFGELHRALVARGFWLADLELIRAVRLRRATYDNLLGARTRLGRRVA